MSEYEKVSASLRALGLSDSALAKATRSKSNESALLRSMAGCGVGEWGGPRWP
jgi:hypothetical protein